MVEGCRTLNQYSALARVQPHIFTNKRRLDSGQLARLTASRANRRCFDFDRTALLCSVCVCVCVRVVCVCVCVLKLLLVRSTDSLHFL